MRKIGALAVLTLVLLVALGAPGGGVAGAGPSARDATCDAVVLVILDGVPAGSLVQLPEGSFLREAAGPEPSGKGVRTVFPSSTASGHAAILTGVGPDANGVTGKEYLDENGELVGFGSSGSPDLVAIPTLLEEAHGAGLRTGLIAGKNGVRSLLGRGADIAASPNAVPDWILGRVGPPPDESSQYDDFVGWYLALDRWVTDAAVAFVSETPRGTFLVLNIAGPDKLGHRFGPVPADATTSSLVSVGEGLQRIVQALDGAGTRWAVIITADHGMTDVHEPILASDVLAACGAEDCPATLDGGTLLVWPPEDRLDAVVAALRATGGVESVVGPRDPERAAIRATHPRSAPVIAVASEGYTFIESEAIMEYTRGGHGTLVETDMMVPLIVLGPGASGVDAAEVSEVTHIADVVRGLLGLRR